jgi:hypothetical protein
MNLKEIKALGLRQKTLDDIDINPADVITSDEFNHTHSGNDYRESAVNRLLELKLSFGSNVNIIGNLFKRFLRYACPTCKAILPITYTGGSGRHASFRAECKKCKTHLSLNVEHECLGFDQK